MGLWKDINERLRGGNAPDYEDCYVCAACFEDEGLIGFINGEATAKSCSFCGSTSNSEPIAAPFVELLLHIKECLDEEYCFAEDALGRDDGEWMGGTLTTRDVLEEELGVLPKDDDQSLMEALCDGLGDHEWCERDPYGLRDHDRLRFSWEDFCKLVKHRRRYFFLTEAQEEGELYGPMALLQELGQFCESFGLIKPLPKGSLLFRARCQKHCYQYSSAADPGPPPEDRATISNRMSPPGIVMLYVSDNPETAVRETASVEAPFAVGQFRILRDTKVLDLAHAPPVPSIFEGIPDSLEYNPRPQAIFLNYFATDISKPVARDDRVHVEYVPTQVVTEFFRSAFLQNETRIDGIRYRSARHPGHCSLVLFATQEDLVKEGGPANQHASLSSVPWIELTDRSEWNVTADDLERWGYEALPESRRP